VNEDDLLWRKRVVNLAQEFDVLVFKHLGGHPVPLLLEALHVFLRDYGGGAVSVRQNEEESVGIPSTLRSAIWASRSAEANGEGAGLGSGIQLVDHPSAFAHASKSNCAVAIFLSYPLSSNYWRIGCGASLLIGQRYAGVLGWESLDHQEAHCQPM
jgi:hypothetical protein